MSEELVPPSSCLLSLCPDRKKKVNTKERRENELSEQKKRTIYQMRKENARLVLINLSIVLSIKMPKKCKNKNVYCKFPM